jgi:hypothetical protein
VHCAEPSTELQGLEAQPWYWGTEQLVGGVGRTLELNVGLISGAYKQLVIVTGGRVVVKGVKSNAKAPTNCNTETEERWSELKDKLMDAPLGVQPLPLQRTAAPALVTMEPELVR